MTGVDRARRPLAGVLACGVLVLGGCGTADSQENRQVGDEAAASSGTAPEEDADAGPYVPGNPQNEVGPATEAELAQWPSCPEVWQPDGTIPAGYEGCVDGDEAVRADRIGCSFGGTMTTYDDRYYGVVGNVVNDAGESLADHRPYAKAYRLCSG